MKGHYNIQVSRGHNECIEFVEWLHRQGHEASVMDYTSYVNGERIDRNTAAGDVFNKLWLEYCSS